MAYKRCPKCGHAPLPEDQALPAACGACGLVLAKFGVRPPPAARSTEAGGDGEEPRFSPAAWLLYVPDRVNRVYWTTRVATLAVFTLWTLWIWKDVDVAGGEIGSRFLHSILLPFHEAGHYAIFRWFGQFIMILGGSLAQLLMPAILAGALLVQRRDPFGAAIFFWLLGFSTLDMAIYMYDAFDPKLMLLGGQTGQESDGHDWQNLFGDMGLLPRSRGIGRFFGFLGMLMMLAALAWAAWVLWLQRAKVSDSPLAEEELS